MGRKQAKTSSKIIHKIIIDQSRLENMSHVCL